MGNVGNWLAIGMRAIPFIFGAITAVERFIKGKGQEKQDAAIAMVETMLTAAEGVSGKELLEDDSVKDAAKKVIDAIVSFQNIVAQVKAAQADPVEP